MDTKECSKCGEEKPLDSFSWKVKSAGRRHAKCKSCVKLHDAKYRADNKDRRKKYDEKYRENNREQIKARKSNWRDENREKLRQSYRVYRVNNRDKCNASWVKYEAAKISRSPQWADQHLISEYYKEAMRLQELTGIKFHVDHIIPLRGELVSGLHVETNLQLLPAHENLGKSNSFDPELFVACVLSSFTNGENLC